MVSFNPLGRALPGSRPTELGVFSQQKCVACGRVSQSEAVPLNQSVKW